MQGLWLEDTRVTLRDDLVRPVPAPGQCRVRVLMAGICATDLALRAGYMGFRGVPGHEFVGQALDGPLAGRRVVGEINLACGECGTCRAGLERHCPQRTVLGILNHGGAFTEQLVLPLVNLHPVPDGVSTAAATFTEPLAAAFEILEQLAGQEFERVLVVGDGRLGLLCAQVLATEQHHVDLVGRHPERAERVRGDLRWIEPPSTPRHDLVIEASGVPALLQQALTWVRPRGTLVLKTTSAEHPPLDLTPLVIHEITLVGSRCGRFEPALAALSANEVEVEALIDARLPLAQGVQAFELAARPGVLKVLLEPARAPRYPDHRRDLDDRERPTRAL
jgi:threonine dehydrogenase-like Zn-dependent dehydrogenase